MWYHVLSYTSWGTSLLPLIYVALRWGFKINPILQYVLALLSLSFAVDAACLLLHHFSVPNSALINFYVFLEFLLLLRIYYLFFEKENWKWVFKLLALGLVIFVLYLVFIEKNFATFSSHLNTVSAITIVVFSVLAYNRLLEECQQSRVTAHYFFWINSAFMIYYLCNLAIFLFKSYILAENASADTSNIWDAHNFFHICSNIMILIGFVVWRKQSLQNTSLSAS